jgi:transcriptional regulator with XRE-family HTH domain
MTEQLQQIAARIRGSREMAGLSVAEVAQELGLEPAVYLAYEEAEADIPVSVLYQLAHRYGVELTAILTGENPRLHSYCLVHQGRGVKVSRRKEYGYQSLAYNFSGKKAEPFLVTVPPAAEGDAVALNSHSGQEFNYVLEGNLRIVISGHELDLTEGDSVYFDSSAPHGMQALGGAPARFLAIIL